MEFIVPWGHIFHKWSRWEYQFPEKISTNFQVKTCITCNKKKTRYVR